MSIMWEYLDRRSAAIAAIKDYESMQFIISSTDSAIQAERDKIEAVRSPCWDGMPHVHDPDAAEDRVIEGIEEINILKERYRNAVEYMSWFQPAWEQLREDEQYVLESFYGNGNCYGSNVVSSIAEHFGIEHTSAYKRKNRALDRLSVLLFGRH